MRRPGNLLAPDSREKGIEFRWVKVIVRAHSAADIDSERLNDPDGFRHVAGMKAASQEDWNRDRITNSAAEQPIVRTPCAPELFDLKIKIAGIEQESVEVRSN